MPVSRGRRAGLLTAICCLSAPAAMAEDQPACFTPHDNAALAFQVMQLAPPPQRDEKNYLYYPLTAAATMQLGQLTAAAPGVDSYYFQWANRSNAPLYNPRGRLIPRKPNQQPAIGLPRKQRSPFTSFARADGCTLAQTASVLGKPSQAAQFARAAGITLVAETGQADAGAVGPADSCVIAAGTLPAKGRGVMLDFEVQDGRSSDAMLAFLRDWAQLVHSARRQALLLIDPFDAPSQRWSGIAEANANAIVSMFDRTTIFLWSRNAQHDLRASYLAQKAMIAHGGKFDGRRILIDFDIAGTSLADARLVRQIIVQDHLAGVVLWRNGARQGGSCTSDVNRKIAAIAFGDSRPGAI